MKPRSVFERDFHEVVKRFPRLEYVWSKKFEAWLISGSIDICDTEGTYWDTFGVIIVVPKAYPYCVPSLFETSEIIPRDIDWHISNSGVCCYDIEHSLLILSRKGINLADFVATKIYTYFANQLFKLSRGKYASGEYAHHFEGVVQYYSETHGLNEQSMVDVLEKLVQGSKLERNHLCPCGSGKKLKKCHYLAMLEIKSLGPSKIEEDLLRIKTLSALIKN